MKQNKINERLDCITHQCNVLYAYIESINKDVNEIKGKLSRCVKKEEEVLPCPFCGGAGGLFCQPIDQEEYFYVKCTNCHCLSDMKETKEEAIEEWNKRI